MSQAAPDSGSPVPAAIARTALVTGAGSGIGRAIALALAADGYRVLLTGRRLENLRAAAHAIEAAGGLASVFSADLAKRDATDALAAWVVGGGEPLTVLVLNAGLGGPSPLEDATSVEFDRRIELNLVAPIRLTRALLPAIPIDGTGRIVVVASVLARFGVPGYHGYCASKAGVAGFARALAREVAGDRISVNAICPGWVRTDMAETGLRLLGEAQGCDTREAERRAMEQVPLGRLLEPDEVAALVRYLVSPAAAGLTGQAVNFDAGVLS
jgi:NAD(P)-dependent dehydrogenase (short-subunit alcohol dehydrogenase family)